MLHGMAASLLERLRAMPTQVLNLLRGRTDSPTTREQMREKIRAGLGALGDRIRFLPYHDAVGGPETESMRRAYREMVRESAVKAGFLKKVLSVASLDVTVTPASDSDRDHEIAKWVQHAIEKTRGNMRRIAWGILSGGLIDGYSICEKVLTPVERGEHAGKIGLKATKAKDTKHCRLVGDEFNNVTGVEDTRRGTVYHPSNFLVWQHLPFFENPLGWSDFRSAYRAYWLTDTAWKLRIIGLEKFTLPMLKGTYSDAGEEKETLEEAMENARSQTWISLPATAQVEALELASRGQSDFAAAIKDLREEALLGLNGAYLQALEGSVGNAAGNSTVHRGTTELIEWFLAAEVADVLNDQAVPDLVDLNYTNADYPTVALGAVNLEELKAELAIDEGLQRMGLPLSKKQVYKRYGRDVPIDEADALSPPAAVQAPAPVTPFDEKPAPGGAGDSDRPTQPGADVAPTGNDTERAEQLLERSRREGIAVLARVVGSAVTRFAADGSPADETLFDDAERQELADALAAVTATADLLGRSRIRERQQKAASQPERYSEEPTSFEVFAGDDIKPLPPEKAVAYFRRLVPTLGTDVSKFAPAVESKAFTLAVATEETLLQKVKQVIQQRVETGVGISTAAADIQELLDAAGVSPRSPQYADMVFRTNAMNAYNAGATQEMQDSDVAETFPVWKYSGIRDGRQGDDHEPHFGRYYPNHVSFEEVRGPRVWNCRCTSIPVDKWEWTKLQAQGAKIETAW